MTSDQIDIFTQAMTEAFPHAPEGDGPLCWELLERFPIETVKESIKRHRIELGSGSKALTPSPNRLLALCRYIEDEKIKEQPRPNRRAEYDARDRQVAAIDEFIDAMDQAEFVELVDRLIEELPIFKRIKGPHDNKEIRAIIFHRIREARAAK